jgi:hypothetical protein
MAMSRVVRRTVRVVGVVLVVALAGLLALRIYGNRRLAAAEREFRANLGPMAGNSYASPTVPDEENAAIYLRAGAQAVVLPGGDKALAAELTTLVFKRWNPQQVSEISRILAGNAPALELLHRAAGMTRSSFGLTDPANVDEDLKDKLPLLKLLWAQRLLWLDAHLALRDGDTVRLLDDARAMSEMAAALERETPLIAELVGIAAEKILLSTVADAVASPHLDGTAVSGLSNVLLDLDLRAAWRRSLAFEFKLPGVSQVVRGELERKRNIVRSTIYLAAPSYFDAPSVAWMARLLVAVDVPYGTRLLALAQQRPQSVFSPLAIRTPNLVQAGGRNQVILSERRLARVALALRRQGLATGAYPDSLDAFPEASAPDPFTGEHIVYTHRRDGSAELSVPGGVKLWERMQKNVGFAGPFTWELPAPGTAVVKK